MWQFYIVAVLHILGWIVLIFECCQFIKQL